MIGRATLTNQAPTPARTSLTPVTNFSGGILAVLGGPSVEEAAAVLCGPASAQGLTASLKHLFSSFPLVGAVATFKLKDLKTASAFEALSNAPRPVHTGPDGAPLLL